MAGRKQKKAKGGGVMPPLPKAPMMAEPPAEEASEAAADQAMDVATIKKMMPKTKDAGKVPGMKGRRRLDRSPSAKMA